MKLRYRLWLTDESESRIFGYGIYQLLRYVRALGSINKACQSMNIPYTKASIIIKRCEKHFGQTLIIRSAGGANGGGSEISDFGLMMMEKYEAFIEEADLELKQLYYKHLDFLDEY